MRLPALSAVAAMLLLAGCHRERDQAAADGSNATEFALNVGDEDGTVAVTGNGSGISVESPVFSGKLKIPGLQLGSDHMDLDGMKPFPGTTFSSVNVDAHDAAGGERRGEVRMAFRAPAAPGDVLAYYADAAKKAGYETASIVGGAVSGTKAAGSRFTVSALPAAGGAAGTLVMSDAKETN